MSLFKVKIQQNADMERYGEDFTETEWIEADSRAAVIASIGDKDKVLKIREAKESEYRCYYAGAAYGRKQIERINQNDILGTEKRIADSWKASMPMYLGRQRQQFLDAIQKALAEIEVMDVE